MGPMTLFDGDPGILNHCRGRLLDKKRDREKKHEKRIDTEQEDILK